MSGNEAFVRAAGDAAHGCLNDLFSFVFQAERLREYIADHPQPKPLAVVKKRAKRITLDFEPSLSITMDVDGEALTKTAASYAARLSASVSILSKALESVRDLLRATHPDTNYALVFSYYRSASHCEGLAELAGKLVSQFGALPLRGVLTEDRARQQAPAGCRRLDAKLLERVNLEAVDEQHVYISKEVSAAIVGSRPAPASAEFRDNELGELEKWSGKLSQRLYAILRYLWPDKTVSYDDLNDSGVWNEPIEHRSIEQAIWRLNKALLSHGAPFTVNGKNSHASLEWFDATKKPTKS
jgi:hypothetical protein